MECLKHHRNKRQLHGRKQKSDTVNWEGALNLNLTLKRCNFMYWSPSHYTSCWLQMKVLHIGFDGNFLSLRKHVYVYCANWILKHESQHIHNVWVQQRWHIWPHTLAFQVTMKTRELHRCSTCQWILNLDNLQYRMYTMKGGCRLSLHIQNAFNYRAALVPKINKYLGISLSIYLTHVLCHTQEYMS